jgi:hypothetical protein
MPANPRPSALLLAPETPYPLMGGGAMRTASLLHYLAHYVDLIVFRQPGAAHPAEHLPAGLVRHLTVIDLPKLSRSLVARALRNAIGVVEPFRRAPYYSQIAGACATAVFDLHNIESTLHARCAATEGAGSLGLRPRLAPGRGRSAAGGEIFLAGDGGRDAGGVKG